MRFLHAGDDGVHSLIRESGELKSLFPRYEKLRNLKQKITSHGKNQKNFLVKVSSPRGEGQS